MNLKETCVFGGEVVQDDPASLITARECLAVGTEGKHPVGRGSVAQCGGLVCAKVRERNGFTACTAGVGGRACEDRPVAIEGEASWHGRSLGQRRCMSRREV